VLCQLRILCRQREDATHIDIVIQLHSPRAIQFNLLQRLSHNIVRLTLAILDCAGGGCFVEVAFIVYVQLPEGILQPKDIRLLELRVLPSPLLASTVTRKPDLLSPLQLDDIHGGEFYGERKVCCRQELRKGWYSLKALCSGRVIVTA